MIQRIRFFIISVMVLLGIVTALGLLFPSTVIVSRAIDVTASKDSVVHYLGNMYQWKKWVSGISDSNSVVYSTTKATLGNTKVTITSVSDSSITAIWQSQSGNVQTSSFKWFKDSSQIQTVIQWQFSQHIGWYPWERFASMMNDKILGTMMEKNLGNLKAILELQQ